MQGPSIDGGEARVGTGVWILWLIYAFFITWFYRGLRPAFILVRLMCTPKLNQSEWAAYLESMGIQTTTRNGKVEILKKG